MTVAVDPSGQLWTAPSSADLRVAEEVVNAPAVVGLFAALEWDELDENGQLWIAGIVRQARQDIFASKPPATFQDRVAPWMEACFGSEISADRVERGDRLCEEVFELLQSGGYDPARVLALRDYVWGRPAGAPAQEVGGVMVTLAAYCLAHILDMHAAGEAELERIWVKVESIRAKQAAKPTGSSLPIGGSALLEADLRKSGWIVASGDGKRFRTWKNGWSDWTENRDEATRYARRCDAEAVHKEDEDAWSITPFAAGP